MLQHLKLGTWRRWPNANTGGLRGRALWLLSIPRCLNVPESTATSTQFGLAPVTAWLVLSLAYWTQRWTRALRSSSHQTLPTACCIVVTQHHNHLDFHRDGFWCSKNMFCKTLPSVGCPKEVVRTMMLLGTKCPSPTCLPSSGTGFISFLSLCYPLLQHCWGTNTTIPWHQELLLVFSGTRLRHGWWVCAQSH